MLKKKYGTAPELVEIDKTDVDLTKIAHLHIVFVFQESINNNYPNKKPELELYNKLTTLLCRQSNLSLLHGGAKELFKVFEKIK